MFWVGLRFHNMALKNSVYRLLTLTLLWVLPKHAIYLVKTQSFNLAFPQVSQEVFYDLCISWCRPKVVFWIRMTSTAHMFEWLGCDTVGVGMAFLEELIVSMGGGLKRPSHAQLLFLFLLPLDWDVDHWTSPAPCLLVCHHILHCDNIELNLWCYKQPPIKQFLL